ncbi:tryptophan synthase subunit beta, partial [Parageobacillus sp. SY1]
MSLVQQRRGYFGEFGGSFVPPELQEALDYLEEQFLKYKDDPAFNDEFKFYLKEYVGRENPLTFAARL